MSGNFQFTVLRYRHSFIIGEVLNIGILFLFDNGHLEFRCPKKIGRITKLYDTLSSSFIKNTFSSFKNMVSNLNRGQGNLIGSESSLKVVVNKYFLIEDAGTLLFSDIKSGVYQDRDQTIDYYYNLFLASYEQEPDDRKSERYILDQFKSIIKTKFNSNLEKEIRIEKTLVDEKRGISETFDYGWQNGSLNLITPISFDLKDDQNLTNKSLKYFGLFNVLKKQAIASDISFDVLVTRPQDHALHKKYIKAIDLIKDSGAPMNIIEEEKFEKYVAHLGYVVLNDTHT